MSIVRVKKAREYVSISNDILQNQELSWEARGVMAYLLSKPDGWECRNYDLVKQGPAGKFVIQRVLKELQDAGYIHRYQVSDGHKIEWVTEIYESPEFNTDFRNTNFLPAGNPPGGSSAGRQSGHIVSTDNSKDLSKESTDLSGSAKNSNNPVTPIVEAIVSNGQAKRKGLNDLATAIAETCQADVDTVSNKTRDDLKRVTLALYKKKVIPDDLKRFGSWWYDNTWEGRKGQAPTPGQVGDKWGQFEAQKVINVPIITDGDNGFYV